eukprot:Em0021g400a
MTFLEECSKHFPELLPWLLDVMVATHHYGAQWAYCLQSSDSATPSHPHLTSTIISFNNCVPPPEAVSVHSLLSNPPSQQHLSDVIEDSQFASLYNSMSCANKARLLSVSSPHASAWLSVVPSEAMGLHLNPFYEAYSQASLSVRLEAGGGLGKDKAFTHPADILVSNPSGSASAAYDITVTSPLNPSIISEAGVSAGTAAKAAEISIAATPAETPASETILGLSSEVTVMSKAAVSLTPQLDTRISAGLVDEVFNLCRLAHLRLVLERAMASPETMTTPDLQTPSLLDGTEANLQHWIYHHHITPVPCHLELASHLAIHQSSPKSSVVAEIYGRLSMHSIARAILQTRELPPS